MKNKLTQHAFMGKNQLKHSVASMFAVERGGRGPLAAPLLSQSVVMLRNMQFNKQELQMVCSFSSPPCPIGCFPNEAIYAARCCVLRTRVRWCLVVVAC